MGLRKQLRILCASGPPTRLQNFFIQHPDVKINTFNRKTGITPLEIVTTVGDLTLLQVLVDEAVRSSRQDQLDPTHKNVVSGQSPLDVAILARNTEFFERLVAVARSFGHSIDFAACTKTELNTTARFHPLAMCLSNIDQSFVDMVRSFCNTAGEDLDPNMSWDNHFPGYSFARRLIFQGLCYRDDDDRSAHIAQALGCFILCGADTQAEESRLEWLDSTRKRKFLKQLKPFHNRRKFATFTVASCCVDYSNVEILARKKSGASLTRVSSEIYQKIYDDYF